jgi:murein DD-endopeptidase MepM/ murein hydrolase activator NlpD
MVIRNEDNFAEKTSFGFTYAKLILAAVSLFIVLFVVALLLVQSILSKWFDPRYAQREANQKLYALALRVDSLSLENERKDKFILNFQRVLTGDTASAFSDPRRDFKTPGALSKEGLKKIKPEDSAFRKQLEGSNLGLITLTGTKYRELEETFFFSPLTGFVSDAFDIKKGHYGVDVVAKSNEPVKCIADGTVVMASWTQDSGYIMAIQHRGNLISVYKHNAELLKKVGNFVNAGEIIAIVGNSGEMTNGPHLHFELWYNGNALNPEEFVTF